MIYLTGMISFGIPCLLDSRGTWMYSKAEFSNPEYMVSRESNESVFKDFGIEKDKIIPYYGDDSLFNVANHVRAYLDILSWGQYDELKGVFYDYIFSMDCRGMIFDSVYKYLRFGKSFQDINRFMSEEFGNAWLSYVTNKIQDFGGK